MFGALLLAGEALAQTRGGRVDAGYLEYLETLEEIGELPAVTTDPLFQLWPGMVGFRDLDGNELGTIFVSGTFPIMREVWFLDTLQAPGEAFQLVHTGVTPPAGQETLELEAGWHLRRCYDMSVKYTNLPTAAITSKLTFSADVDRYTFELRQDHLVGQELVEVVVGRLLREHHHVPNTAEQFVDHWAFYGSYDPPYLQDESVWMVPTGESFATAAAFFQDVYAEEADEAKEIWKYAQIIYKPQQGFVCATALNL